MSRNRLPLNVVPAGSTTPKQQLSNSKSLSVNVVWSVVLKLWLRKITSLSPKVWFSKNHTLIKMLSLEKWAISSINVIMKPIRLLMTRPSLLSPTWSLRKKSKRLLPGVAILRLISTRLQLLILLLRLRVSLRETPLTTKLKLMKLLAPISRLNGMSEIARSQIRQQETFKINDFLVPYIIPLIFWLLLEFFLYLSWF